MGANVLLWLGPVSTSNLSGSVPPGFEVRTYNHGKGEPKKDTTSNAFRDWAYTLGSDPLTRLAGPSARRILLCGFSAAHGAHEVILGHVAKGGDERLRGLLAADAYYTAPGGGPKPGHLAWLQWLIEAPGGRCAYFTTSHTAGSNYPSGAESIAPLAAALGARPRLAPAGVPSPVATAGRGAFTWADYGTNYSHGEHATKLAGAYLRALPELRNAAGDTIGRGAMRAVAPLPVWLLVGGVLLWRASRRRLS